MKLFNKIAKKFPALPLKSGVPYREITTLGVGSVLPVLAEPESVEQLSELVGYLNSKRIAWFVFGAGSNVVGMDKPYNGIGIRLSSKAFSVQTIDDTNVICGAYVRLPRLAADLAEAGLGGLSPLAGIPGTIGGAVRMNAGANGTEIGNFVRKVSGIDECGNAWEKLHDEINWRYRGCDIPANWIITQVEFAFTRSTPEAEQKIISDELAARRAREPFGRTAGCVFRNVSSVEPAGMLIDRCGLRDCHFGNLALSAKHANYIINLGSASEEEYFSLVSTCRRAVAEKYGFYLQLEQCCIDPDFTDRLNRFVPAVKVNVLAGGTSSEREVSLQSATAVYNALKRAGLDAVLSDIKSCRVTDTMKNSHVVYPVLHGGFGENGELQKHLEREGIAFVGSGSVACNLIMDKILTKRLLDRLMLPTARWKIATRENREFPEELKFPVILKVPDEGSTFGIIKVDSLEEWKEALDKELKLADEILVEEFIDGIEITVPIIQGRVLDAIEIRSPNGFYDYDAKYLYKNGHTEYFCPPVSLSESVIEEAKRSALILYRAAGCRDILRVDFIIGKNDNIPYMLEGNAIPGCTETSLVPKAAKASGISFERMTTDMVYAALRRPANAAGGYTLDNVPNTLLVNIATWMVRFCCWCCGVFLLAIGVYQIQHNMPGIPLMLSGILVIMAESIFNLLNKMRKNSATGKKK
ncbi:MAG: D-alanine--D-alanine ligase [Lentisphaeria bacterium]|nr:D-alanine--D-alanine ligase [Lentisphaeria bacterium]